MCSSSLDDQPAVMEEVMSQPSRSQVFSCPECPYAFTSQVFYHKHLRTNHDDLYCQMLKNGQIPTLSHINTYCEMLRNGQILPAASQKGTSSTTSQKPRGTNEPSSYSSQQSTNTLPQPKEEVNRQHVTQTDKKTHICKQENSRLTFVQFLKG